MSRKARKEGYSSDKTGMTMHQEHYTRQNFFNYQPKGKAIEKQEPQEQTQRQEGYDVRVND